jgi:deoxycytidylate deaminase
MTDAEPCKLCKRMIINSGIAKVITYSENKKIIVTDVEKEWIKTNMGEVKKVKDKWVVVETGG